MPRITSTFSFGDGQQVRPAPQRPPPTSLEEIFRLWGLDPALRRYVCRNLGIDDLYPWQARCLALPGVAEGTQDLLYSAPTSGGKTMVAELLLLLRVVGLPQQQRCSMETETGQERGGGRRAVWWRPCNREEVQVPAKHVVVGRAPASINHWRLLPVSKVGDSIFFHTWPQGRYLHAFAFAIRFTQAFTSQ